MLALSETFGRSDVISPIPPIPGYSEWKTERGGSDKGGGGLCLLYKPTLTPHHWTPQVPPDLLYISNERQWLLLDNGKEKCAFLHVYIACASKKNDGFLKWNEDLFMLLTQEAIKLRKEGFIVCSLGDFNTRVGQIEGLEQNTPDINRNTPMFLNFVSQVNLVIINSLPLAQGLFTRFMNGSDLPGSKSLIDYGLIDTDHTHTVSSFVIDENARFDAGADHALLVVELVYGPVPGISWSYHQTLKLDLRGDSDFVAYQTNLDQQLSSTPLHHFQTLPTSQMLPHLTEWISESGKQTFGLRIKKKRVKKKLPISVIKKIKAKNELARTVQIAYRHSLPDARAKEVTLNAMKAEIKELCSDIRLKQRNRLRSRALLADPSRRKFWRFLKHQIKTAGSITGAYDITGKMVFQQNEIEEAVLSHFTSIFEGQKVPFFLTPEEPDQIELSLQEIDDILKNVPEEHPENKFEAQVCSPYSMTELNRILNNLPLGKSSGYDQIPNELLKQSSPKFKMYLQAFLNQILKDGKVPPDLNLGKCCLIHKVLL